MEQARLTTLLRQTQKELARGVLRLMVLQIIAKAKKPIHGYALITKITQRCGFLFGASTVYPMLHDMQEKGILSYQWDLSGTRACKTYTLTSEGRTILQNLEQAWDAYTNLNNVLNRK